MSKHMEDVKKKLDEVSSCFCLAKWLQVTVHLQNGQTHSCHHPLTHKIPLEEIQADPSALHNTAYKKQNRKLMLEGKRPNECVYCWNIEDSHQENLSDRVLKSANEIHEVERISKLSWEDSIIPNYLEVSFGNECNFKCAYCAPHISSAIMSEYRQFGAYISRPDLELNTLKKNGLFPYEKDEPNPYVKAFWEWWPKIKKELKIFRLTGGEPLLNSNTFKFLESIIDNPLPDLEIAINSNLGIPEASFEKFLVLVKVLVEKKHIKKFSLYTSLDTYGKNGEFIRFGMNYERVMRNINLFLSRIPEADLNFMCTYNAFSVVNFDKFLFEVTALKKAYKAGNGKNRVHLDIPYLKDPGFLSCYVLTEDFLPFIHRDVEYLKHETVYTESEVARMERILKWLMSIKESKHRESVRAELFIFLQEYQKRKEIKFLDYCPEYSQFYATCKLAFSSLT